jgi:hypothetical protein
MWWFLIEYIDRVIWQNKFIFIYSYIIYMNDAETAQWESPS